MAYWKDLITRPELLTTLLPLDISKSVRMVTILCTVIVWMS